MSLAQTGTAMRSISRQAADVCLSALVASDSILTVLKEASPQDRETQKNRCRAVAVKGVESAKLSAWPRQELLRLFEELLDQVFGAPTPEEREALWRAVLDERKRTRAGL